MKSYPTKMKDVRDALMNHPDAFDGGFDGAVNEASPVAAIVKVFDALKAQESLTQSEAELLCGAAHLIATNSFFGKGAEAMQVLISTAAQLPDVEEPAPDPAPVAEPE